MRNRRKVLMTAALGCLAVATAADAHVAGSSHCTYGAADTDTYLELARLEPRGGNYLYLA